jgi:hypothetical protein
VTLAAAIEAELPNLRTEAEATYQDTFTAYRPDATATATDANGFEVPGYATAGTTPGKVAGPSAQSRDTNARTVTIGGSERPVIEGGLHVPVSAPVPATGEYGTGWEYVLTALGPLTDPSLLNSRWLVVDAPAKSYATARRLDVVRLA